MSISVVYYSKGGTTHQVADAIGEGIAQQSVPSQLLRVTDAQIIEGRLRSDHYLSAIDQCSAVIFGSPTYMGGPAAQFKTFCDASSDRWERQSWSGKLAAGFTVGSSPGGDQLATLQYFSILAAQHGMLWVNLQMLADIESTSNAQLGFAGTVSGDTISESDKSNAAALGSRVAAICKRYTSPDYRNI